MDWLRKRHAKKPKREVLFFEPNIFFLRTLTMYLPDKNWNIIIKIIYYLWRMVFCIAPFSVIVLSAWDMFLKEKIEKVGDIAMNIMYVEIYMSISFRSIYHIATSGKTEHLVLRARKEFREQTIYALEPDTKKQADFENKILFTYFMIFVHCAAILMFIGSLAERSLPLPIPLPPNFDYTSSPTFEITLLLEMIVIFFMTVCFGNLDMLHSTFMLAIAEQFRLLGVDFANVVNYSLHQCGFSKEEIAEYTTYGQDEVEQQQQELSIRVLNIMQTENFKLHVRKSFLECITHHQQLLDYFEEYQQFLTMIMLLHINLIFLYLIFTLFVFLTNDDPSLYPALSQYFWGSFTQIVIISKVGSVLEDKVEFMRQSLYNIPWYNLDKKILSDFKIVQIRMTKPINMKAGKLIVLNLELFLEFMKKAFSFFTVLRRMNQEEL